MCLAVGGSYRKITKRNEVIMSKSNIYENSPDYDNFENKLLNDNPELTGELLDFYIKKKRGFYYYKLDLLRHVKTPDLEATGYTYLTKRNVLKKTQVDIISTEKGRISNVYDELNGTPVGFIPMDEEHCIMYVRPKVTMFNILFPICLIRIAIFLIYHK